MGMAIRSGEFLPLFLPPLFWARLVHCPVTPSMLAQSHYSHVKAMTQFAGIRFSRTDPTVVVDGQGEIVCQANEFDDLFCKDFTMVRCLLTLHVGQCCNVCMYMHVCMPVCVCVHVC